MRNLHVHRLINVSYHLALWGAFNLLFVFQNPNATARDYASWAVIIGVLALVSYFNLYFLLPRYFFKKQYWTYAFALTGAIWVGAYLMKILTVSNNPLFNTFIFQSAINLLFFVIFTSSLKFFRAFLHKEKRLIIVENHQLKTELSLLKSQVNPHFLFNTLNNLYGLVLQNPKAADVVLRLSDLMRYLLESSKTERVSLKREIQFIEDYLALEKIRLTQEADIRLETSGLDRDIFIAPLLFIPLVENAFKHGLNTLSSGSFAHFSLSVQGNEVFFEAQNSVGQPLNEHPKSQTGLANLRKRLELIYPDQHTLELEQNDSVFKAILHITI